MIVGLGLQDPLDTVCRTYTPIIAGSALTELRPDTIEAMSSHRPYRAALGVDAALTEIGKNRGRLYDSSVVDASPRLFHEKDYTIPT